MDPRPIDPTSCWMRHVRRATPDDAPADVVKVAGASFVTANIAAGLTGINGTAGWQSSTVTLALSDDGTFSLTLPNGEGDDGVLHRRRFAVLIDSTYEPGEEWIEVWSDTDPEHPLFVGTPTEAGKSRSTVDISGVDLGTVLDGSLTSDVDTWSGHAPRDVLRFYGRVPVSILSTQNMNVDVTDSDVSDGYTIAWQPPAWAGPAAPGYPGAVPMPDDLDPECWSIEVRCRLLALVGPTSPTGDRGVFIQDAGQGWYFAISPDKEKMLVGAGSSVRDQRMPNKGVPQSLAFRMVRRYEMQYLFCNGELVATSHRETAPPLIALALYVGGARVVVDSVEVESLAPFATRGPSSKIDLALPGIPPGTGLRAQYWNRAGVEGRYGLPASPDPAAWKTAEAFGIDEPSVDRVEPRLLSPGGETAPGMPGPYAARWSGAIRIPFSLIYGAARLRLNSGAGINRLYLGRTMRTGEQEVASSWAYYDDAGLSVTVPASAGATIVTDSLSAVLGSTEDAWYPIVVERYNGYSNDLTGALEIEVAPGVWTPVDTPYLSPIGVYANDVRLDTHRNVIVDVAQAFGYQWRTLYRSLESGEFPGQITAGAMIGRQSSIEVDDASIGSDPQVKISATDVIDRIAVDGAGIADPNGSGQLTVQTTNYPTAGDRLALRSAYESLSDISEAPLLMQRANSLLALRSGPNDQVGVQPPGTVEVTDTFPLTGALARFDWSPGDGVRLRLDSVDVVDDSPRQLTTVAWAPRPDGLGRPTVGFRQRPRNVRASMRRLVRAIYGPRRSYQGTLVVVSGSFGATDGASPDPYSRVSLPSNIDDVKGATLVVHYLAGATPGQILVNGVATGIYAPTAGRYDVSGFISRALPTSGHMYAGLTGGSPYELALELLVAV